MNEKNRFALVPGTPGTIAKAKPGAKRLLAGMVTDTLALVKREQLSKPRIVLVNDSPDTVHLMEALICDWFKEATLLIFQSGAQAWQELQREDPDLLITDMMRPDDAMDGWAMIPLLAEKRVKYPVVIVSACSEFSKENDSDIFKARSAEYHSLLQHARQTLNIAAVAIPFDFEQLRKVLEASLEKTNVKPLVAASRPVSILFSAEHIIPNLKAKERFAAIREMVAQLINIGRIRPQDEEVVVNAMNKREKLMSTGIGFGVAIPRGRVDCVKDIVLAIGVSASGVEFDALDNQPVNVIVMFIIPANSWLHEAVMQTATGMFGQFVFKSDGIGQLLRSNSAEEMWSILKPVYDDALALQAGQRVWREFELKWRFGARTAALIVKLANRFVSRIQISRSQEVAEAKSFMDLCRVSADMSQVVGLQMSDFRTVETADTADIGCGDRVRVSVEGPDAAAAMEALTELFTCGSRVERCIEPGCLSRPALGGYTKDYISYGCKKGHGWDVPRSDKS